MTGFTRQIDAGKLAAVYQARMRLFPQAVARALRTLAVLVHRQADRNISGGGAAWNYPVPRRSGVLARSLYSKSGDKWAVVGADLGVAPYAWAIHSGVHPRWKSPPARPRPFLTDAADGIDHLAVMQNEVRGAW